jgi:tetratricopeptide (TPR) repeat protein
MLKRLVISGAIAFACLQAPTVIRAEYVGSEACVECHKDEFALWRESHHYQAMRRPTEETVIGDFSGVEHRYAGVTSRFYMDGEKFMVETDNQDGELQAFEIAYTFGFEPLQQYLIAFPDGRYQALNVVWDARPRDKGGQRWVHLYPDDEVRHDNLLHWTGSFQNWNTRCASCHSTELEKNWSISGNRYDTTWNEINVGCEACHGPAREHLDWAAGDQAGADRGFEISLADRGVFSLQDSNNPNTFVRQDGQRPHAQTGNCAACHSRRGELSPHDPTRAFDQQYRLALLDPNLYFPDGQILDEVYVYGSFLQSRMHLAGVVCTDCHEPHSNRVRVEGNGLCAQCHLPTYYDQASHHHHEAGTEGAACVNCHMPARTYMVVDDRRDHRFGVPDPHLSTELGTPNACNQCHQDKDAAWSVEQFENWGIKRSDRSPHARALHAAWNGDVQALPALLSLASSPESAPFIRASAISASRNLPARETVAAAQQWLASDLPLIREAAARSLDWLTVEQRYALLASLVDDPSRSVRMAVAQQLIGLPLESLPLNAAQPVRTLLAEYRGRLDYNADMPEEQISLALYHQGMNDPIAAEQAYRKALQLAPFYMPAMLNLADLYRANGMDPQAEPLLREALRAAPDFAAPYHALGLLLVRRQKLDEAVPLLGKAAELEPLDLRYAYVHAVALWENGERQQAVASLERNLRNHPGNPQLLQALAGYYRELGETEKFEAIMQQMQ